MGNSFGQTKVVFDGNELLINCSLADDLSKQRSASDSLLAGYCYGLVHGVSQTAPGVCVPQKVPLGQAIKVVLKFLNDNPNKLQIDGAALTRDALSNAFPCPSAADAPK